MNHKSIICISTHFWSDFWFRKQHFMSRFAKQWYKILYVQPTHSMVRPYRKPELADNRFWAPVIKKLDKHITLFSPPMLFPKPTEPISSIISHKYISWLIGRAARQLGMDDGILWIYRPEYAPGISLIPHRHLVFDLADDLSSYNESANRMSAHIGRCTDTLAAKADLMVVTSPTLKDLYQGHTRRCELVPNGFDEKLFDGQPKPIPPDMAQIPKPIAGFVGTLFSFLDYELIYEAAKALPDVSFVFVGPVEKSGKQGVELVNRLKNTYFLGPKKKETIPAYVSNFNVCINPFKVDNVSKAVSPLKVYEYLATGRPVLSTPMAGLEKEEAGKRVQFAKASQFVHALSDLTKGNEINTNQIKAANAFSWSSHFKDLLACVKELR
jgi:glycosyltransferase involved in cell wall biosynthesis